MQQHQREWASATRLTLEVVCTWPRLLTCSSYFLVFALIAAGSLEFFTTPTWAFLCLTSFLSAGFSALS